MSCLYADLFNCLNNALRSVPILLTIQSRITCLIPFNLEYFSRLFLSSLLSSYWHVLKIQFRCLAACHAI